MSFDHLVDSPARPKVEVCGLRTLEGGEKRRGLRKFQGQLDGSDMGGSTPKMVVVSPTNPWGFSY